MASGYKNIDATNAIKKPSIPKELGDVVVAIVFEMKNKLADYLEVTLQDKQAPKSK